MHLPHFFCCCLHACVHSKVYVYYHVLFFTSRDKSTFLSLLVYAVFSAMELGFGEIYPVWAKTSPHLGTDQHPVQLCTSLLIFCSYRWSWFES